MKAYSQTETNIILNFSASYAKKSGEILSSDGFNQLLTSYIESLEKVDDLTIETLKGLTDTLDKDLTNIFKLLISFEVDEIIAMSDKYKLLFTKREELLEVVEGLYNYWRHFPSLPRKFNNTNNKSLYYCDKSPKYKLFLLK